MSLEFSTIPTEISPRKPDPISALRESFGLQESQVTFHNLENFQAGSTRFLYGFTESDNQAAGFLKMARASEGGEQLKRESSVMETMNGLGVPTVAVLKPYKELPGGFGAIELKRLDAKNGELLASNELIASAPSEYGDWAAKAIEKTAGREIPAETNLEAFKTGDWRNESPETFWKVWEEGEKGVLSPENNGWLTPDEIGQLHTLYTKAKEDLQPQIDQAEEPDKYFFVHNDTAPNNTFFDLKKEEALLLDFEHGGVTHNRVLAHLTDYGNFYARTWPNPKMQTAFLKGLLDKSSEEKLTTTYTFLRSLAVYSSFFLAKYGMEETHPEHNMARKLLKNLPAQLQVLEEAYSERKQLLS